MAERTDIDEALRDVASWGSETEDLKTAFATEMVGRQYGDEPLVDAWLWFAAGWGAASVEVERLRAIVIAMTPYVPEPVLDSFVNKEPSRG